MASNEIKVKFLDLKDVETFVEAAKRIALRHPDTEDDLATMLELAMPALKVKKNGEV